MFENPIRSSSSCLTVLARSNGTELARIGIIVAKRYVKKAVMRHRIRRLIRESFRHHKNQLSGLDVVVLLRVVFKKNEHTLSLKTMLEKNWQEVVKKSKSV